MIRLFAASAILSLASPFTTVAQSTGALTVTTHSVDSGSIPRGATRVSMIDIAMQASCSGPATVRSVTVVRQGLGAASDINGVYATANGRRLTRVARIDSKLHTATLRFAPQLVIPACGSKTMTIAMDVSATANISSEHQLLIEFPTDIMSDATVTLKKEATTSVQTTVPSSQAGSISYVEVPTTSRNVLFGKDRTLLRFRLKATGNAVKQQIDSITFTNDGSATDGDIVNLRIVTSTGEQIGATTASMDGDRVRLDLSSSLILEKNEERLFQLRGDVTASRRKTIDFTVEEPSDIEAKTVRRTGN